MSEQATIITRRKTADGFGSYVWTDGAITSADSRPWTRHRNLPVDVAVMVNIEASLFDATEMPHLIAAAVKLNKRGEFLPGDLRAEAHRIIVEETKRREIAEWSAKYRADVAAGRREPDRSAIAQIERDHQAHIANCRNPWCKRC